MYPNYFNNSYMGNYGMPQNQPQTIPNMQPNNFPSNISNQNLMSGVPKVQTGIQGKIVDSIDTVKRNRNTT